MTEDEGIEEMSEGLRNHEATLKRGSRGVVVAAGFFIFALAAALAVVTGEALLVEFALNVASPESAALADGESQASKDLGFMNIWLLVFCGFFGAHILVDQSSSFKYILRRFLLPVAVLFLVGLGGLAAWAIMPELLIGMTATMEEQGPIILDLGADSAELPSSDSTQPDISMQLLTMVGSTGLSVILISVPLLGFTVADGALYLARLAAKKIESGYTAWQQLPKFSRSLKLCILKINDLKEQIELHEEDRPTAQSSASKLTVGVSPAIARLSTIKSDLDSAGNPENVTVLQRREGFSGLNADVLTARIQAVTSLDIPNLSFAIEHGRYPRSDEDIS